MNIEQLLQDYSIPFYTKGKNVSAGWIGIQCPFCEDTSNHLGYNLDDNYFTCWLCGTHFPDQVISKLLNIPEQEARKVIKQYGLLVPKLIKEPQVKIRVKAHRLPSNAEPLNTTHRAYLSKRGFDPDLLERTWNLLGTGPFSQLSTGEGENKKMIDYRFRILIPFIWDGQQVSFDSRDITGKDPGRYKACPKDRELIPHKEILYGKQECWKETGILVEGPTDVWRFGTYSCACSGIKFTSTQVRLLASKFTRVAVCFDSDPQADIQAAKMVAELKFRGVDAFRVDIEGDPGSMKQSNADYLVKQLIH
jgi:DNA primase